jgi:hypothetical protein
MARRTVVVRRPARARRTGSMMWVVVLAVLVIGGIVLWAVLNNGNGNDPGVGMVTNTLFASLR